jgi:hypothetical protein
MSVLMVYFVSMHKWLETTRLGLIFAIVSSLCFFVSPSRGGVT